MIKRGIRYSILLLLILSQIKVKSDSDCESQDGINYDKVESRKDKEEREENQVKSFVNQNV